MLDACIRGACGQALSASLIAPAPRARRRAEMRDCAPGVMRQAHERPVDARDRRLAVTPHATMLSVARDEVRSAILAALKIWATISAGEWP
jgi:hypothetical protein